MWDYINSWLLQIPTQSDQKCPQAVDLTRYKSWHIYFIISRGVNVIRCLGCMAHIQLFSLKLMCRAAQWSGGEWRRGEKNPSLLCLEVMPFCGFNTRPNHCALVSPAISSNLATLNWILCKGPSVLWERRTLFSVQRVYSGAVVFWITPGLTSQTGTAGVTFHFLLATGKRSIP